MMTKMRIRKKKMMMTMTIKLVSPNFFSSDRLPSIYTHTFSFFASQLTSPQIFPSISSCRPTSFWLLIINTQIFPHLDLFFNSPGYFITLLFRRRNKLYYFFSFVSCDWKISHRQRRSFFRYYYSCSSYLLSRIFFFFFEPFFVLTRYKFYSHTLHPNNSSSASVLFLKYTF